MLGRYEKNAEVAKARKLFQEQGIIENENIVPPMILRSWRRSREANANPNNNSYKLLKPEELQKIREQNTSLLETAIPTIEIFFEHIQNSLTNLILTDSTGVVLCSMGGGTGFGGNEATSMIGFYTSEAYEGTNSMGLCLEEKQVVSVIGAEHYKSIFDDWYCTSAPIMDEHNKLIGTISFVTHKDNVHLHTLGMVSAVSKTISEQLKLKQHIHQHKAILELLKEGVIVLDKEMRILEINSYAQELFRTSSSVINEKLSSIVTDCTQIKQLYNLSAVVDKDITLSLTDGKTVHCTLSSSSAGEGIIINLRERTRIQSLAKRLIKNTAKYTFNDICGNSKEIVNTKELAKAASTHDATVLLLGESGVGKELFAQAIHNASYRKDAPFIAINCGAIPKELVQSELFGYEAGAFTGALKEGMPGKFEQADGGTIFLDEIGDMPLNVQVNLLRLLQEGLVVRIGGKNPRPVDARIIAATNKDLLKAVEKKLFRKDLYYRLNVFGLTIPPLRERMSDIPLLARHFLKKYQANMTKQIDGFAPEVLELLSKYSWVGNIRELENIVERATIVCTQDLIQKEDLPLEILQPSSRSMSIMLPTAQSIEQQNTMLYTLTDTQQNYRENRAKNILSNDTAIISTQVNLKDYEGSYIKEVLTQTKGNIRAAAKMLGISRGTLYKRIKEYGIERATSAVN